jgi:hypothetical protein
VNFAIAVAAVIVGLYVAPKVTKFLPS